MKKALLQGVLGAAILGAALLSTPAQAECKLEAEIMAQFDKWNAALQTGKPEEVAKLYAKDGVLLPTVSNRVRDNTAAIEDYFHHFLELKPKGTINEHHVHCYGDDVAVNSGVYTFDVVKQGKPAQVKARYNYVYHRESGEWKIVSHHSSAMPEPVK